MRHRPTPFPFIASPSTSSSDSPPTLHLLSTYSPPTLQRLSNDSPTTLHRLFALRPRTRQLATTPRPDRSPVYFARNGRGSHWRLLPVRLFLHGPPLPGVPITALIDSPEPLSLSPTLPTSPSAESEGTADPAPTPSAQAPAPSPPLAVRSSSASVNSRYGIRPVGCEDKSPGGWRPEHLKTLETSHPPGMARVAGWSELGLTLEMVSVFRTRARGDDVGHNGGVRDGPVGGGSHWLHPSLKRLWCVCGVRSGRPMFFRL